MARVTRMQCLLFQLILTSFVFFNNVNAGITSSYVRSYPAVDMPLDHEVFAVPKGYNAPQQVHITQGNYDGNAVIISWVTVDEPGLSKLQYGTSDKHYEFTAKGRMTNYTFYEYKSGYIHHVVVDGLKFNTKYYYKIGDGDSAREFWFRTPPKIGPDVPYKFGIIGDIGQTYNSLSTLEHYMDSGAECVLFLGDFSYADEYKYNDVGLRWDTFGRFAERSMAYHPWIWIIGNHEIDYLPYLNEVTMFKTYYHRYPTPYSASKSSSPEFYAVRRASAHIIALSSYSPFMKYTPQYDWLSEELERVNRTETPWLFVLVHAPLYSSYQTHFMEAESMRVVFEKWFVKYKVDVVFSGHVHAYERSHRISNIKYNVSSGPCYPVPDESAPIYITVGDGGNLEGLADYLIEPQPNYSAFREPSYGHSTLEIMNRTHAVYTWHRNDDGKKVPVESFVLHNQYWKSKVEKRNLGKQNNLDMLEQFTSK